METEQERKLSTTWVIKTYKRYWKETKDKYKRRHFLLDKIYDKNQLQTFI